MPKSKFILFAMFTAATGFLAGCNQAVEKPLPAATSGHVHDGWWCGAHGVPEEVCALCNSKLVADFKAKGDWCSEHDRPESQCFICNPEREAEFAAQYEAKYGKQPPKTDESEHGDHPRHES